MFIAIRKYRVRRGSTAEWAQRVRNGFVPMMEELAGFRGYYLLDGGPDAIIAISMFDTVDEALVSNAKAADWVRNNVMEFARGMPEIMVRCDRASTNPPWLSGRFPITSFASRQRLGASCQGADAP